MLLALNVTERKAYDIMENNRNRGYLPRIKGQDFY